MPDTVTVIIVVVQLMPDTVTLCDYSGCTVNAWYCHLVVIIVVVQLMPDTVTLLWL